MGSSFLLNCFVIFDSNSAGEETASEDGNSKLIKTLTMLIYFIYYLGIDIVLYFYPPGVSADAKFHLFGWCSAMINFSRSFTAQPLEVAILERYKIAFKQTGSITMVDFINLCSY